MFRNRFSTIGRAVRRITRPLSNYRRKIYGTGLRGIGKNEYTYDPKRGGLVPLNAISDTDDDDDEDDEEEDNGEPHFDLVEITPSHPYIPPIPGPDHVKDFVNMDEISPEFGKMFFQPIAGPQHSYIRDLDGPLMHSVLIGRKTGKIKDLPESGALPTRIMSDPKGISKKGQKVKRNSIDPRSLGRTMSDSNLKKPDNKNAASSYQRKGSNQPKPKVDMISIGTGVTPSLFHHDHKALPDKTEQLVLIKSPSISEPGVQGKKYMANDPVQSALTAKKKVKKAISWGAWTLFEFITHDDDAPRNSVPAERRTSEPHIGVQNLAKCPSKSNLHKS